MAKLATNASGAMWLPNLVQVTESISGSVVPLAMFLQQRAKTSLSQQFVTNVFPDGLKFFGWPGKFPQD